MCMLRVSMYVCLYVWQVYMCTDVWLFVHAHVSLFLCFVRVPLLFPGTIDNEAAVFISLSLRERNREREREREREKCVCVYVCVCVCVCVSVSKIRSLLQNTSRLSRKSDLS